MPKRETLEAMAERKRRSMDVAAHEAAHVAAAMDRIDDARRGCLGELAKLDSVYFGDERSARRWVREELWAVIQELERTSARVGGLAVKITG